MTGIEASWYEFRRNIDRLPEFVNPENTKEFPDKLRGRLGNWLESRLKLRLGT
jgi:hypothetical protein